jgi:hypothetical protein
MLYGVTLAAVLWGAIALSIAGFLAACSAKPLAVPNQAPPAQGVYIPIAKPCEVAKVDPSPLATEQAGGAGSDLYEAVKRILADREILIGDRTKLQAANSDPCPASKEPK